MFDEDRKFNESMSFHLLKQEMNNYEDECFISDQEWKMVSNFVLVFASFNNFLIKITELLNSDYSKT